MDRIVISLVSGGVLGGTFALIGLGLVLTFRSTQTLNFAHGQFMAIGAYIVARWQSTGVMPWHVGTVLSCAIVAALGVLFYLLVVQRTIGLSPFMSALSTLGVAAILDGVISIQFGVAQYPIKLPLPTGIATVFGARVPIVNLILTAIALGAACVVTGVLRWTQVGTRMRAAGQNPVLASQGGIHVRRLYMASWALAGVLAALAGTIFGAANIVSPSIVGLALATFPAIALGGLDSLEGAIVGGIVLGIAQAFVATYLGGGALELVTYLGLLVVLLVMPNGLFGTRVASRV